MVAGEVLVLGKPDAAAARTVALLPGGPAGFLGDRLDHRPGARVAEMREPEGNRIDAGRGRQFIHEGLEREYVGVAAERAQRRHPDRHVLDEMGDHLLAREGVERDGVAVTTARGLGGTRGWSHFLLLRERSD